MERTAINKLEYIAALRRASIGFASLCALAISLFAMDGSFGRGIEEQYKLDS
jgi:hypothetical protein